MAEKTIDTITLHEAPLATSAEQFAKLLFTGLDAFFSTTALFAFIKSEQCQNQVFELAVQTIFPE